MADEDKKVVVPSSADSAIKPSDQTRIAPVAQGSADSKKLKTIKLKPLKTVAPASPISDDEETISMRREDSSQDSQAPADDDATVGINRTISETVTTPPMPEEGGDSTSLEDDATVKIEKVSRPQPGTAAPSIPGVKQTIKLRPSSSVSDSSLSDAAAPVTSRQPASKQTLKLTPTPPPTSQAEPQTGMPDGDTESQDPSKRTIKLVAKKPSAPTVQTPHEGEPIGAQSSKRTLKIRTTSTPPPAPPSSDMGTATEHGAPPAAEHPPVSGAAKYPDQMQYQKDDDGTSAFTAVAASISLLALAYFAYQLFSQYKALSM